MTTLVSGATGFVGGHLVKRLPDAIPLTRRMADLSEPLPSLPRADRVIHCAAEIDDRTRMSAVNVDGTARLVEWARASGVRQFVYLSTGGREGPYAETKRAGEKIVLEAGYSALRLFFPYGPGQRLPRLVPRLFESVRQGKAVTIDPAAGPSLSLTYIDDVVEAIERVASLDGSHLLDVGAEGVTLRAIATAIGLLVGREPRFETAEALSGSLVADPEPLRVLTAFTPSIRIEEGLARCV